MELYVPLSQRALQRAVVKSQFVSLELHSFEGQQRGISYNVYI